MSDEEEEGGRAHSTDSASEDEGRVEDRSVSSSDSEAPKEEKESDEDNEKWACPQKLASFAGDATFIPTTPMTNMRPSSDSEVSGPELDFRGSDNEELPSINVKREKEDEQIKSECAYLHLLLSFMPSCSSSAEQERCGLGQVCKTSFLASSSKLLLFFSQHF